jgi:hypothetical protein
MRQGTKLLGITAGLIAGAATLAWAASLDVATGLWDVTSQGETTGIPPIPPAALAHLTPEQRQKVQAAMADAVSRSNQPNTTRLCITQKELDQGLRFNTREQQNCKQTALNTTSHTMDAHMECKGDQHATGNLHVVASDRQTISGNFDFLSTDGTNTVTMKRTLQGKWLGSDCGTVKPYEE